MLNSMKAVINSHGLKTGVIDNLTLQGYLQNISHHTVYKCASEFLSKKNCSASQLMGLQQDSLFNHKKYLTRLSLHDNIDTIMV